MNKTTPATLIVAPFTMTDAYRPNRQPQQRIVGRGSGTAFNVIDAEVMFHPERNRGGEHLKLQLVAYGPAIADPMGTPPDISEEQIDLFWQLKAMIEVGPELLAALTAIRETLAAMGGACHDNENPLIHAMYCRARAAECAALGVKL